jgi:hypothetical protein
MSLAKKLTLFAVLQLSILLAALLLWQFFPRSDLEQNNYLGTMLDMRAKLAATKGQERILLVGGSNIGTGVSAEALSQQFQKPVFNLGVHAGVGYRNIWEVYKDELVPGKDTIVLSPEYELLTKDASYYPGYCKVLFLDKNIRNAAVQPGCWPRMMLWSVTDVPRQILNQPFTLNIYYRGAVNEYGDVVTHLDQKARLLPFNIFNPGPAEADLANYLDFVLTDIRGAGFSVVYVPVVLARAACEGNLDSMTAVQSYFWRDLGVGEMPDVEQYCLANWLFFDTIYHANRQGRVAKTKIFAEHISAAQPSAAGQPASH